jgi:long-chain acyl-CoA synthetase
VLSTPLAAFGTLDLDTPGTFKTLIEIFDNGLMLSRNEPFLGHRPVLSKSPLKFADHYVWETYAQVDARRRNLGSALHPLFQSGVLGGGEMETVGIWSPNRPGMCPSVSSSNQNIEIKTTVIARL